MFDMIKSRLDEAFKEATKGISIYMILSITACTILIHFKATSPNNILDSLMESEISNFIGEKSMLLNIKIKEIIYAAISAASANFTINKLKSEYFDLLYETILKNYITQLKTRAKKQKSEINKNPIHQVPSNLQLSQFHLNFINSYFSSGLQRQNFIFCDHCHCINLNPNRLVYSSFCKTTSFQAFTSNNL